MPYSESSAKPPRPPLDEAALRALGLSYVGRYATTRGKLSTYLARKLRERGWAGQDVPDIQTLIADFVARGYVDDTAFATARAEALVRRGYGQARVRLSLRQAGIDSETAHEIARLDSDEALQSALRFARRKRIGPFGPQNDDPKARNRAVAAMLRAGHDFEITRRVIDMQRIVDSPA